MPFLPTLGVGGNPIPTPSAYYRLDEASGDALEQVAGLTATAVNAPGGGSSYRSFVAASSQKFQRAGNAAFGDGGTGKWELTCAFRYTAVAGFLCLFGNTSNSPFTCYINGTTLTVVFLTRSWNFGSAVSAGAWHTLDIWWDGTTAFVDVDSSGVPASQAAAGPFAAPAANFGIGDNTAGNYFNGDLKLLGIFQTNLTSGQRALIAAGANYSSSGGWQA